MMALAQIRTWLVDLLLVAAAVVCAGSAFGQPYCRVLAESGRGPGWVASDDGSGVIVANDGRQAFVVSNWHVIRDGHPPYSVQVPGRGTFPATLVRRDEGNDLSLFAIHASAGPPIRLAERMQAEQMWFGGFGGTQSFSWQGSGAYAGPSAHWQKVWGRVRSGDSGGPVVNGRGELVGILWGCVDNQVYFAPIETVRRFMGAVALAAVAQVAQASSSQVSTQCRWIWDGQQWAKVCETRPVQLPPPPEAKQISVEPTPPATTATTSSANSPAAQAAADAKGWTAATTPIPAPSVIVNPIYAVPVRSSGYGADWHQDVAARVAKLEATPATATATKAVDETKVTAAIDQQSKVIAELPSAVTTAIQTGMQGLQSHVTTTVTQSARPSWLELAGMALLVATGGGAMIGGTVGIWKLAAWAGGTLLRSAVRRYLAERNDEQPAAGPGGPASDKHFRGRGSRGGRA